MFEVAVLIDSRQKPLWWHLDPGREWDKIPDSASLWDNIWSCREDILGIAHTHPGSGHYPFPSSDPDLTTFEAVEAGLGRRLIWWIVNETHMSSVVWRDDMHEYVTIHLHQSFEPKWVLELRQWAEVVPRRLRGAK